MKDLMDNWHSNNQRAKVTRSPYDSKRMAQKHCSHKWDDGSSAIIHDASGRSMCAICKKRIGGE